MYELKFVFVTVLDNFFIRIKKSGEQLGQEQYVSAIADATWILGYRRF